MDVQMSTVPTGNNAASTATGKASTTETATKDTTFNQVLDGQIGQESASDDLNVSDPALSLNMLLQMLQSLVLPLQGAAVQEIEQGTGDQPLSEMLLEAMNSNPALAEQLLQDPNVKKWFEDAEQLLSTLGDAQSNAAFTLPNGLNLQPADTLNLQAQNTLLTLTTLSKQQPDNPILKFLNQDLISTIGPLLPELMATLKGPTSITDAATNAPKATEGLVDESKSDTASVNRANHVKKANKPGVEQKIDVDSFTLVQPTKSKLELLAIKNVLHAPVVESTTASEESFVALVDLPTEDAPATNSIVTIGDLQKAQQAAIPVDKVPATTINAANFTEEMTEHVLKNMKITMAGGFSEAKLSLFPKNLGHIDVRISMQDGQLVAQFAADSLAGKQMLESQLPQLRQALQTQGLQVEKLEVTQNQNMQSSMFQDQRQQQTFGQSQRQSKNGSSNYDEDSIDFNQEIENIAQIRTTVNGNSFDVIA
ncbi:flagellar hook-length control protein FliK [Paenibacillus sp. V4I3]|uniref:flagellar hook-length control protein FliK n=1 Tax=unclassified Paenibacillus TaxID=185978 RepID=UPI00278722CD|nr:MULTISPECIES: flagellar hook-length control protein FliK [unclassified Paenibacillus]MDQ0876439.1 flagellar hook-length control protein FliK [Paenibacillus sp. V4I3]MDQ0887528.1 flagellar hook-length control protein FliK [Paenibacillus sp. V4I9]